MENFNFVQTKNTLESQVMKINLNDKIIFNDKTIIFYENLIPQDTCDAIIKNCDKFERSPTTVEGIKRYETAVIWNDELIKNIYSAVLMDYIKATDFSLLKYENNGVSMIDNFQDQGYYYKIYFLGDFYDWHYDSVLVRGQRESVISFVLYLNDDFDGGELMFKNQDDVHIRPKKGSCILFPSGWSYMHKSTPITKGNKKIIATWLKPVE